MGNIVVICYVDFVKVERLFRIALGQRVACLFAFDCVDVADEERGAMSSQTLCGGSACIIARCSDQKKKKDKKLRKSATDLNCPNVRKPGAYSYLCLGHPLPYTHISILI